MQILRLLAARRFRRRRRAVSTITATTAPCTPCSFGEDEDEGPFFDLDLSCCSAPASTASSQAAESGSESEDSSSCFHAAAAGDLDFVISLHRSRSASPSYQERLFFRGVAAPPPPPHPLKFCASEPSDHAAASRRYSSSSASRRGLTSGRVQLRTLSFGGRVSFSRSSSSSARSARLFAAACASPDHENDGARPRPHDVFRRYLSKISSRLRRVAVAPNSATENRLRKSRSASAAQVAAAAAHRSPPPARRDDTLLEKQDGIASAIAHCKESLHRASTSECDTSLLRSRSDPGARAVITS